MARTDWTMNETVKPEDFNQIGTEIQEAKDKANQAEQNAKQYTDQQIASIPEPEYPVTSVHGRQGDVASQAGDYAADQISLNDPNFTSQTVKDGLNEIVNTVNNGLSAIEDTINTHKNATLVHGSTEEATPNRIVQRDDGAQFKVGAPTDVAHVARKGDIPVFATKAQAEAGTAINVIMSPERTKQAIEKLSPKPDVIWRINTSNNLPEWSNDNGGSWFPVAAVKSVQRGYTSINNGATSQKITISPIVTEKSLIFASNTTASDAATNSFVRYKINNSAEIEFTRQNSNGAASIEWQVVEYY